MEKRRKYLLILIVGICIGIMAVSLLYLINLDIMETTITTTDGAFQVLIALIIRISILAGMAIYLIIRWFSQEEIYTSDLPFLFGMFFLILMYGKLLDVLTNFLYPSVSSEVYLTYLKIRQLSVIGTLAPMIFLSIMMIFTLLQVNGKIKKYSDSKEINIISLKILIIIAIIEAIIIIITPNTTFAGINFAIFVVFSLLVITWIFYFSYRNKRLSQVHPLIVAIGFTAYLFSNILRPIAQNIIGENALFIVITEIIDIIIGLVIFIGYIKKVKY
ncbi:MAG: hypothetical protein ACFFFT_09925 [Candidatus Thorarchaeota archaeon]